MAALLFGRPYSAIGGDGPDHERRMAAGDTAHDHGGGSTPWVRATTRNAGTAFGAVEGSLTLGGDRRWPAVACTGHSREEGRRVGLLLRRQTRQEARVGEG
jgi:hypothetical protein